MRRIWLYIVIVFLYLPFLPIFLNSFASQRYISFPPQGFTLEWYFTIPSRYWDALSNSLLLAISTSILALFLGTLAAIAIDRSKMRHNYLFRTFFNIPLQVPNLVVGIILLQFYSVLAISSPIVLLGTFPGLLAAHVAFTTPYVINSVSSVLVHYNDDWDNAARTLGATDGSLIRRVSLPIIAPGFMAGMFYVFTMSFGNVPVSLFLIGPDYSTLPITVFMDMQFNYQPWVLSVSTIVMGLSFLLVWLGNRFIGFDTFMKSQNLSQ